MDSDRESSGLMSSAFFGRINNSHCDLDGIAFSPPSSEISPFIHIQTASIPNHSNNAAQYNDQYSAPEMKRFGNTKLAGNNTSSRPPFAAERVSKLMHISRQSFDNLQDLKHETHDQPVGEYGILNHVTQSLPASPLSTPSGTPQTSPRPIRHALRHEPNFTEEARCTLPWYYPGLMTVRSPSDEASITCKKEIAEGEAKSVAGRFGIATAFHNGGNVYPNKTKRNKKFVVGNREMNLFAPTSM